MSCGSLESPFNRVQHHFTGSFNKSPVSFQPHSLAAKAISVKSPLVLYSSDFRELKFKNILSS